MELAKVKKGIFCTNYFVRRNFFIICVLSQWILYLIHFQNIHTFTYQKTSKNMYEAIIFNMYSESVLNTLYIETKHKTKSAVQKMTTFFFGELQFITVLLLICDSNMSWRASFVSLKLCVGFSISDSISFLLKLIFLLNKMQGLFDFKTS